ncbi:MAG TPA: pectin acetylesterase-family hydrolase [Polyangiaceae bacterium LLY-WYZ-14_1]|nr:pectin acetylesterase-family hydrolase [Polyangiaceae bacterium LLY-WYZ-14_1]
MRVLHPFAFLSVRPAASGPTPAARRRPSRPPSPLALLPVTLAVLAGAGCGDDGGADLDPCVQTAAEATVVCVEEVSDGWADCLADDGADCRNGGAAGTAAVASLRSTVGAACADGVFADLTVDDLADRLAVACTAQANSLAWRSFGGPQAAVWNDPDTGEADRSCLAAAHAEGADFLAESARALGGCLAGGGCGGGRLASDRAGLAEAAETAIADACGEDELAELVAVDPATFVERAAHQADCLTATAYPRTGGLDLTCGPDYAQFTGRRGEYVDVVVDRQLWGAQCADGSDYRFSVRLAPEGAPLDRVIIGLQGGGVCVFEEDCAPRLESNPGLFTAEDDEPPETGIFSLDPEESAFADFTHVYLPYCNQDVFAGGGRVESFDSLDVPRFGGVNLRAAVQMVRDVLWKMLDEADEGPGFRPDQLVALVGGWSAGGYGTLYNYHWFLDDLQWPRTAAFPDAGLALDNGQVLGVSGIGLLKIPVWGTRPNLPPYCFGPDCAVGPVLYEATAPRLETVPGQQYLVVSNPRDQIQQRDAFFGGEDEEAFWINTLRQSYCDTKDLPGIEYFLTSVADESIHVVSLRPELWNGTVDGVQMRDWFARAVSDPDSVQDRAEEGDFVDEIPGVEPFPCDP